MSKRVLLTGVAGFIGAHTLEHLLENTNWHITGVDSLEHRGDMRRVDQVLSKNPELWVPRFRFIKMDLAKAFYGLPEVDYVINMASESHVDRSIEDPAPFIRNNVNLTINMLEYARKIKPEVFIQVSTDEVYGPMLNDRPFNEGERHIPSNPYSASKSAQEAIAISYWRTYGVPVVITNTMNNIGEMQHSEKFLPLLIKKIQAGEMVTIHGDSENMGSRFYLHARNHADALLFILTKTRPISYFWDSDTPSPSHFHITGDARVSNLELAEMVAKRLGKDFGYVFDNTSRPGHDLHYGLDGSRLKNLGWRPPLDFETSLERTIQNYLDNPEWLQ